MKKLSSVILAGALVAAFAATPASAHGRGDQHRHVVNGKGKIFGFTRIQVAGSVANLCDSADLASVTVTGPSGTDIAATIRSATSSTESVTVASVTTTTSYCNISWQAKRLLKGNYTVKYSLRCDGTAPAVVAAECTAANVKSRVSGRHGDLNPLLNADSRFSVVSDSAGSLVFTQVAPVKVKKAGATVLRRLGLTVVRAS